MKITATQKQIRQTPRKMRLVANQVKNLSLEQAMRQLAVINRRASLNILKVIKQAIASAMNNHRLSFESLTLANIQVTPGPVYKRWRAVSRGRAHSIMKRTSHVRVELETKEDQLQKPTEAKTETKEPTKTKKKVATKTKKNK